MPSSHRLDYGSISIHRAAVTKAQLPLVIVNARCICGKRLAGTGENFSVADRALHDALGKHQQEMEPQADGA